MDLMFSCKHRASCNTVCLLVLTHWPPQDPIMIFQVYFFNRPSEGSWLWMNIFSKHHEEEHFLDVWLENLQAMRAYLQWAVCSMCLIRGYVGWCWHSRHWPWYHAPFNKNTVCLWQISLTTHFHFSIIFSLVCLKTTSYIYKWWRRKVTSFHLHCFHINFSNYLALTLSP